MHPIDYYSCNFIPIFEVLHMEALNFPKQIRDVGYSTVRVIRTPTPLNELLYETGA